MKASQQIISDYHVHSSFSGDCSVDIESIISYAINKNICNLCFTEHLDLDFNIIDINFEVDLNKYVPTLLNLKDKYQNKINIYLGIEIGIQPHLYEKLNKITEEYPFDFILCSNHLINGLDPYDKNYYLNKTKHHAYREFWESILYNAKNYNGYDVLSHLDYHIRYAPYDDKSYNYSDFSDELDEILKTVINNGKGIEVNTSGFRYKLNNPHPSKEVIFRYRELGGEIITIGSDSHRPEDLCSNFDLAKDILKNAGFKYYTIFKQRKPEFIKL